MDATAITTALIFACAAGLIGWDIYVAFFNRIPNSKDTVSGQIKAAGEKLRAVPFAFGALGGHLFWPGRPLLSQPWAALILVALACVASLTLRHYRPLSLVALAIGVLAGHLFWPQ